MFFAFSWWFFSFLLAKLGKPNYISRSELCLSWKTTPRQRRWSVGLGGKPEATLMTTNLTNLSASLEDYLEAILNLTADIAVARSKDIAVTLNVAKSSVTGALKVLARKDLVNYTPYGYVRLTPAGLAAAQGVARNTTLLNRFSRRFWAWTKRWGTMRHARRNTP